jgi:hypothetical protein
MNIYQILMQLTMMGQIISYSYRLNKAWELDEYFIFPQTVTCVPWLKNSSHIADLYADIGIGELCIISARNWIY